MRPRPAYGELLIALRRVLAVILLAVLPAILIAAVIGTTFGQRTFLYDFRGDLYDAGRAILHGLNPYKAGFLHQLAELKRTGGSPSETFAVPVYPAPGLLAAVPLALLPYHVAGVVFTVLSMAALVAGLQLLGVRDWRCFGAAFLSYPVWHSLRLGQVDTFLLFGAAIVWRRRRDLWPPALAVASVVAAKLFLWPLAAWLLVTRRLRTAALALMLAAVGVVGAWAVLGFAGFAAYPRMLADLTSIEGGAGVSITSAAQALGVAHTVGVALGVTVTGAILAAAWATARRPDGEARAFGLALMAGLTCSPVVWPHYMALVFVPIALSSPSFSVLWLVPLIAYAAPAELSHGDIAAIVPYLIIEVIVVVAVALGGSQAGVRGLVDLRSARPALVSGDR
jgi:hypothetical protein